AQGGGVYLYTPAANYHGQDAFTFRASDGQVLSQWASVAITVNPVNDAPVAQDYTVSIVQEDTPLAGVLWTFASDVDEDALGYILVSGPAHGTFSLDPDGHAEYRPEADFHGTDSLTWKVSDGQLESNVATLTLVVNPVNDAPLATGGSFTADQETTLVVPAPGVLDGDTDVDGDALLAVLVDAPLHGSLTLNPDGSFAYVPEAGYSGGDAFSYAASDGTLASAPALVTIQVQAPPSPGAATGAGPSLDAGGQADDGTPDVFRLFLDGAQLKVELNGQALYAAAFDSVADLRITGSGDDDTLTLDLSGGNPIPGTGVLYDGAGPGDFDVLRIAGEASGPVIYSASGVSSGTIELSGRLIS
ncbi:MAG: tandem-95 repeat protein, partial [Burkholderiales bacterium]|nr:tandem-95 repeat protein [Burkholderiales bacterium]